MVTNAHAIATKANATDAPLYTCPYRFVGTHWVTGYVPGDPEQCGASHGIGRSGKKIVPGEDAAMYGDARGFFIDGKRYPYGTRIHIVGLGEYGVYDSGVGPGVIDVACENSPACYEITGKYAVYEVLVSCN
jgi:hypothetical protein